MAGLRAVATAKTASAFDHRGDCRDSALHKTCAGPWRGVVSLDVFACAGLIGATPELLIQREAAQVRSRVIAGTAGRGSGSAGEHRRRAALLASAKDASPDQGACELHRDREIGS
jgi:hypothetical protein